MNITANIYVKFGGSICYRNINPTKSPVLVPGSNSDADAKICDSARRLVHIYYILYSESGAGDRQYVSAYTAA
jgi:hypothetical protein